MRSNATASEKNTSIYLVQVALYQAYLNVPNPALFTVINADTCELLHFFVPFDAERAQLWSECQHHRSDARRRTAAARV